MLRRCTFCDLVSGRKLPSVIMGSKPSMMASNTWARIDRLREKPLRLDVDEDRETSRTVYKVRPLHHQFAREHKFPGKSHQDNFLFFPKSPALRSLQIVRAGAYLLDTTESQGFFVTVCLPCRMTFTFAQRVCACGIGTTKYTEAIL